MDTNSNAAFQHMVALTGIGSRVAGTDAERRAADYISGQLAEFGAEVELQRFPTRVWLEKDVRLSSDAAVEPIHAVGVPFGGSLRRGQHEFDLIYAEQASAFDLQRQDVQGKALLLSRDAYIHYPDTQLVERLASYGPALLIFTASPGHHGVPVVYYNFRDVEETNPPPCLSISHEAARKLIGSNEGTVIASLEAEVRTALSQNVIGVLRGTELADEIVVVCAHYDSTPTSPGACDNAGGSSCVLEIARAACQQGPFRRTVHFVLLGSHETGMHGSEAYITRARASGAKVVAAINFDTIGQTVGEDRLSILGGEGFNDFVDSLDAAKLVAPAMNRGPGYTDYTNFGAAGIPALSVAQCYVNFNHTPNDSLERCSPTALVKPLFLGSALVSAVADHDRDFLGEFPGELRTHVADFNSRWGWSNFTEQRPNGNP